MREENLNILKQFENILKKCLFERFGEFLPAEKKAILNHTEYVKEMDLTDLKTRDEVQGKILRNMLDSLIDITCLKEIEINMDYAICEFGRFLEDGIIEYYAREISARYRFDIDIIEKYNDAFELSKEVRKIIGDDFDKKIFVADANELLNDDRLEEVRQICDNKAADTYLENIADIIDINEDSENKSDETNIKKRENAIQLISLDDHEYLKYIDYIGKVHLLEIYNIPEVTKYYQEQLEKNENIDIDEFLVMFNEINKVPNSHENENIKSLTKTLQSINGNEIDDKLVIPPLPIQEKTKVQDKPRKNNITEAEYEMLCIQYANGEELTPDEMLALQRYTPDYMTEEEMDKYDSENHAPVLKLNQNDDKNTKGYMKKSLIIYVVIISLMIGTMIGFALFRA